MKLPGSTPFRVMLDFDTGSLTPFTGSFVRRLSEMADAYEDQAAVRSVLASGDDPVVYTGYDGDVPSQPGHLLFRTTIISPGTVGSEYFMTKGHHHLRDSAELYLGMSGEGFMLMETRDGDFAESGLVPSASVYVPPGWAHRTVRTAGRPAGGPSVLGRGLDQVERPGAGPEPDPGAGQAAERGSVRGGDGRQGLRLLRRGGGPGRRADHPDRVGYPP
jgi:glucose-6-phosphate isomerase, archaeal